MSYVTAYNEIDAAKADGFHQTLYNLFVRWICFGVSAHFRCLDKPVTEASANHDRRHLVKSTTHWRTFETPRRSAVWLAVMLDRTESSQSQRLGIICQRWPTRSVPQRILVTKLLHARSEIEHWHQEYNQDQVGSHLQPTPNSGIHYRL